MTKDEILSLDPYTARLTDKDIEFGMELYTEDAEEKAVFIREYSSFIGNVINTYGHKYYHEFHIINKKYLANLTAQPNPDKTFIGFLFIKEAEYFQNFNAYAEVVRNINSALELEEDLPIHFKAAALNCVVGALWNCNLYKESEKYMKKMEDLMESEEMTPLLKFTVGCNLMNGFAVLGDRIKTDYYYDLLKGFSREEVGDNFYCFLEIFKLSDEAKLNADSIPSQEYIEKLRESMKFIYPGNGIEEDYADIFIPIVKYVRGFAKDAKLVELCLKIIETTYSLPDKINIYMFMFKEFGMTKETEPVLYSRYYDALVSHYKMIAENRKHEITNEIMNEELAEKYRISAGTDALTGLGNRTSYEECLDEIAKQPEFPDNLYVVMLDLNGLKGVNDTYGHDAGDEFIRAAGECITKSLNSPGKVFRIGGDEFMAIVYNTPTGMDKFMEDLDAQCAAWKGSHNTPLSISKGFSQTRDIVALEQETRRERIEKMAKIADRRMYEDKKAYYERTGKDRRR